MGKVEDGEKEPFTLCYTWNRIELVEGKMICEKAFQKTISIKVKWIDGGYDMSFKTGVAKGPEEDYVFFNLNLPKE